MRDKPDALMLFAAGFGKRMGHLTQSFPKPMLPIGGRLLIDHALDLVWPMNLSSVVANLHFKPDLLAAHLSDKNIALSLEQPKILETGGGLKNAMHLLGKGPVFTLNTDAVWIGPNPLELLEKAWESSRMDALLMCVPPEQAIGHSGAGDFVPDQTGRLTRGPGVIYTGAQILKTEDLNSVRDQAFSLNIIWDMMLRKERVYGLIYPGKWCDVGHPDSIAKAEALLGEPHV